MSAACATLPAAIDRLALLEWLRPNCEPDRVALLYPKRGGDLSPGWVMSQADAERALASYRDGTLPTESFQSITKSGKAYRIKGAVRLGLVPHRNGRVLAFCVDLDDHAGDGGTVHLGDAVARFLGAEPIVFTSKGGKGLHCFFRLAQPIEADAFVVWSRAWGFNRQGEPEVFPKTTKNTQAWLPNEPNDHGGDAYVSGTFDSCVVTAMPIAPSTKLTTATLHFLRGFVRQPGRNEALNKSAFELGRKRVPRADASRLCMAGARLCGLDAEEPEQTRTTFESGFEAGAKSAPDGDAPDGDEGVDPVPKFRRLDGIGNGERFIDQHGRNVRFSYELDSWLVWTGKRWSLDAQSAVESMAKKTARLILKEMERALDEAREAGKTDDELEAIESAYRKQYVSAARVHGVRDMLTMAQSEPGVKVTVSQIDASPMLLNVRNGTIDLTTGRLRPHDRSDGITKIAPATFDPDADSTLWQSFLDRIFAGDEELIAYIQRAVGYSLTGQVGEQCLFFLHGTGQNGKSVFIQTLLAVLGEYAQKAPTEMIMKQDRASGGGATPDMARLRGVRLAVTAELDENQRMGEARVKDLTGADRVVARKLYCDPVEFDPTHKLWIYGNHKPSIRGTDDGIWRRMRLVPFAVTIPNAEKDPRLIEKLSAERDGILAWAVRGCIEWQRDGLGLPHAVASATDAYRSESDRLAAFLEECCVVGQWASIGKSDLYSTYEAWCRESGEHAMSKRWLGIRLAERGFADCRDKHQRSWIGLGLLEGGLPHAAG
ncbi:MAG: phage/plasmid primase, P4 family [Phycisphaerales bacterium]